MVHTAKAMQLPSGCKWLTCIYCDVPAHCGLNASSLVVLLLCRFALLCLGGLEAPLNLPIKRDK
jgi:hypothetical protein